MNMLTLCKNETKFKMNKFKIEQLFIFRKCTSKTYKNTSLLVHTYTTFTKLNCKQCHMDTPSLACCRALAL